MTDLRPLLFRELREPVEVVAALRLRHRIYFELHQYGPCKALRLDLTAHDERSRLYGVFRGTRLVGSVRLVLRHPQPLASLFHGLRAVVDSDQEDTSKSLPSEEAFDVDASLGTERERVDGEISRFVLEPGAVPPTLAPRVIVAALAAAESTGCRLYLYSCAVSIAKAYARLTRPRFVLVQHAEHGITSDGFVFPKPTQAAIAAPQDSPFARDIAVFAERLQAGLPLELGSAHHAAAE